MCHGYGLSFHDPFTLHFQLCFCFCASLEVEFNSASSLGHHVRSRRDAAVPCGTLGLPFPRALTWLLHNNVMLMFLVLCLVLHT